MGLIAFIKDAGEKLFGTGEAKAAQEAVQAAPSAENVARLNAAAAAAIKHYIETLGLPVRGLEVGFDGASTTATVAGEAADQASREKVVLAAGNVENVSAVEDRLTVAAAAPEAVFYTVVKGDTLWKIAQQHYGNGSKYPAIFEANQPMLTHPDRIYPGQVLRIPPAA